MEKVLWLMDIASEVEEGGLVVWLWCKDYEGSVHIVKQRYRPSFYLVTSRASDVADRLARQGYSVEEVQRKIRGRNVRALKVYVDVEDVDSVARKLVREIGDAEAYEDDVRPSVKYLIENGLKPSGGVRVKGETIRGDRYHLTWAEGVEYVEGVVPPPLRVVAFDPVYFSESGSPRPDRDPVILISIATPDGRRIQLQGDEKKIIGDFLKIVEEEDPDVVVGFSTNRIHWSYLVERARRNGMSLTVGRLGSEPHTSTHGHTSIRGRLNIDLEDMAREIPELTVETLEEFTSYLGIEHDFNVVEDWEVGQVWRSEPDKVRKYSMQRAEALIKCYEALKDYILSLSELTGMPADYVLTASTGFRVENYLMYVAAERGELVPKRSEVGHVTYAGGLVKSPRPGLHENVAVVDFRSMYPSLMMKYNISFDTLSEVGENIAPNDYRFRKEPEGFLPYALRRLILERKRAQERLSKLDANSVEARVLNARQRAIKVIANAVYGYTGWVGARWYSREVAEATASWGRQVISEAIRKAEELGMKVIYSDTDSLFLQDYGDALDKLLKWIEEDLGLEAKLEKIYRRVLFTEAKKKYAGLLGDSRIDIVGLEAVRGDWSLVARRAQDETVRTLLFTGKLEEAVKTVKEHVKRIVSRNVEMRELIIWRQITRPLDEYEATQPHIVVARQLIKDGWRIQPGDKVGYVVVQGSGPLHRRVKPYFKAGLDEVDWEYYLDKQVLPACMRVLEPFGVKADMLRSLGESTLTDFF